MTLLDRIHWPQAFLLVATIASLFGFPILFLWLVPEHVIQTLIGLPWMTIITLGIPALVVAIAPLAHAVMRPVVAKAEPDSKAPSTPQRMSSTPRGGFVDVGVLVALVGAALFALAAAALLSGCGASAVRTHAIAAHSFHELLEESGPTITASSLAAMNACPHDDGAERSLCLENVEHVVMIAGAAHDTMIPLQESYRSLTFAACDIDATAAEPIVIPDACTDPPPDVMARIVDIGSILIRDQAILAAAIAAFASPTSGGR